MKFIFNRACVCLLFLFKSIINGYGQEYVTERSSDFTCNFYLKWALYKNFLSEEYMPICYEQFKNNDYKKRHIKSIQTNELTKFYKFINIVCYDTNGLVLYNKNITINRKKSSDTLSKEERKYTYNSNKSILVENIGQLQSTKYMYVFNDDFLIDTIYVLGLDRIRNKTIYYEYNDNKYINKVFQIDLNKIKKICELHYTDNKEILGRLDVYSEDISNNIYKYKNLINNLCKENYIIIYDSTLNEAVPIKYNYAFYSNSSICLFSRSLVNNSPFNEIDFLTWNNNKLVFHYRHVASYRANDDPMQILYISWKNGRKWHYKQLVLNTTIRKFTKKGKTKKIINYY